MLQVYQEKYSYVRTYINFTGSGVCEIQEGGTVIRRDKQGKERSGCETQGLRPWVLCWGRRPPWLVYCVLPLRILRIPLARLVGQADVVYRKVKWVLQ